MHRANIIKTHKEKYCYKITDCITQKHTNLIDMIKTSIRRHAYVLLFPFFTGISVAEATAQTTSLPEPCRYTGNTEACVMTEDDAMTETSHTVAAYTIAQRNYRTEAGRLESPQTQNQTMIVETPKYRNSTFYANIGYGRIISKIYMVDGATGNPKNGFFWQLGYDWTSRKGIGVGLMYNGFKSSFEYYPFECTSEIMYLAPQLVLKKYKTRWAFEGKFGIGFFKYTESAEGFSGSYTGYGYNLHFGAEYMVSRTVGIGASLGLITGYLPEQKEVENKDSRTGIAIMDIGVGVRVHL